eukprot:scaffold171272_cov35-Tisochrysis_lutea.AAC.4
MAQTEPPLPPELALPEASRGRQQAAAGRPQGSRGRSRMSTLAFLAWANTEPRAPCRLCAVSGWTRGLRLADMLDTSTD